MVPIFLMMNSMASRRRAIARNLLTPQTSLEQDCCRTCLGLDSLEPIFCDKESEKIRSDDLYLVTGLKIKFNDGLSQKICRKCIQIMHMALRFRRTSKKAEKTLLSMVYTKSKKRFSTKPSKLVKFPKKHPEVKQPKLEMDVEYNYDDSFQTDDYSYMETEKYDDDQKPLTNIKKELSVQKPIEKRKRQSIPLATTYKCTTCDKEFRMKATFKAHMRFHTSYSMCEACGKRCRNNNQLQEHKRARHGLGKIHKCAYCEYSSATKEALTIHERRHTGERPYVCDHCAASFHRRSNLVQHIAIHLPERNFQCYICLKWEKSRRRLQSHIYRHQEKKYRFLCPVCKESFARPGNVRKHLLRAHNVPRERQGRIERYER